MIDIDHQANSVQIVCNSFSPDSVIPGKANCMLGIFATVDCTGYPVKGVYFNINQGCASPGLYSYRGPRIRYFQHTLIHCAYADQQSSTVAYSNYTDAEEACSRSGECFGVYDSQCDGTGDYKLCAAES